MAGIQKNMQYKASRSTRLLNNLVKDDYGQQRQIVCFGFQVTAGAANSNQVNIGSGAIYNQNGQKIFAYDDISAVIDVIPSAYTPESQVEMYVICLKHSYAADTSINEPTFESVRVADWLPRNVEPVKDIREMNIVSGFISDSSPRLKHSTFNPVEGFNVGQFNNLVYGENDILGYDQTPLCKIIINWDTVVSGNIVGATGAFDTGVGVYNYKNPWEQLRDYTGVDFFEPTQEDSSRNDTYYLERWNDNIVNISTNTPFAGVNIINSDGNVIDHNYNDLGRYQTTQEARTPTNNPLYGYFSNIDNSARYRYSSYLDDGHSIKWNLQRISETVRAIESKVGGHPSRPLTSTYQATAPKSIATDISNNAISQVYDTRGNYILRNGGVGWYKPAVGDGYTPTNDYDSLGTTTLADDHHTALTFLDRSIGYIYNNRLGLTGILSDELRRQDVYSYNINLSSTSFDRESWNVTSLSGDPGQGSTFKEYAQHIIDEKLHRDGGYADGWVHFGTDTSQDRQHAGSFNNYYSVNGINKWFDVQISQSSYFSDDLKQTPLHIGNEGIYVQKFYDATNDQIWPDVYDHGIQIGPAREANTYGSGVLYPDWIRVQTPLENAALEYRTTSISGNAYNRSSIVGGEALNLSAKKRFDAEIILDNNLQAFQPPNGTVCTVTWATNDASITGYIGGTIVDTRTPFNKDTRVALRLNKSLNLIDMRDLLVDILTNVDLFYAQPNRFTSSWNGIEYWNSALSGYLGDDYIGLTTISFYIPTTAPYYFNKKIQFNVNEFNFTNSVYDGQVNVVDRISGDPVFNMPARKGSPYAAIKSNIPMWVPDWITVGEVPPSKIYSQVTPLKGGIIGDHPQIVGNSVSMSANESIEFNSNKIRIKAGSKLIIEDGAELIINGTTKVNNGGFVKLLNGAELIAESGSEIKHQDGSNSYHFKESNDYYMDGYNSASFSTGDLSDDIFTTSVKISNIEFRTTRADTFVSDTTNFPASTYVPLYFYYLNESAQASGKDRRIEFSGAPNPILSDSTLTFPSAPSGGTIQYNRLIVYFDKIKFSYTPKAGSSQILETEPSVLFKIYNGSNIVQDISADISKTLNRNGYQNRAYLIITRATTGGATFLDNLEGQSINNLKIELQKTDAGNWKDVDMDGMRVNLEYTVDV